MKNILLLFVLLFTCAGQLKSQQIKVNFANNLIDSSNNHYLIDTNQCGNVLTFCDDASGNPANAYQFNGQCGMQTDSFSMTNTAYNGFSVSFYMNKNFDSSVVQYGILHFYKGTFLIYAVRDSLFMTVTDSLNNDHVFGAPCNMPNDEWFCTVITFTDYGTVDFYFNKVKYHAGNAAFKSLRRACEPGFCYPLHISTDIWDNEFYKGKLDDIRVWNWPSDSVNVDEICTKNIVPAGLRQFDQSGVKMYPNPANSYIIFESNEPAELLVYDISGRLIQMTKLGSGLNRLPTAQFSNGNYLIQIKNTQGVFATRLAVSGH